MRITLAYSCSYYTHITIAASFVSLTAPRVQTFSNKFLKLNLPEFNKWEHSYFFADLRLQHSYDYALGYRKK